MRLRWLGAATLVVMLAACSREPGDAAHKPKSAAAAPDSIVRLGSWVGTLPCADCTGIRTELTLFAAQGSGTPIVYHLRETYLGTPEGDRTTTSSGRWTSTRGVGGDPAATVYEFAIDTRELAFRAFGDDSLRMLSRSGADIVSNLPYTLVRRGAAASLPPPPSLVTAGHTSGVVLRPEQEFFVRLPANHSTGFQWALADTARGAVEWRGTHYIQDMPSGLAVGVGGNEYWRFHAARAGDQALVFVYRRPWEVQPTNARTVELDVSVR